MTARNEIIEELRGVLLGRVPIADAIVPPLVFVVTNAIAGLEIGAVVAVASAVAITIARLWRRKPWRFALAGLGGVTLAVGFAVWSGGAEGFFVPGILSGTLTAAAALLSIAIGRPMLAWTSMLARRWPAPWYWHPKVRPAYTEVTWLWAAFFAGRTVLQWNLAQDGDLEALAIARVLGGWPALVILLVVTYMYGTWRLGRLGGPSVEEFQAGAPPPWAGQRRGF